MTHPALADAAPTSAWLDSPARPDARPPLAADTTADLVVVGGGYTGLWTAVLAKERDPGRDVVLVEAQRIGWAASGRNGGFCSASLTHGRDNGEQRFPDEIDTLERLGQQNLAEIESAVGRYGIDCGWELTGSLSVATEPHQVAWLREADEGRSSTRTRSAPRSPPRRTSPGSGPATTTRSSTRPGWPGGWPTPPSGSACGSTSTPR